MRFSLLLVSALLLAHPAAAFQPDKDKPAAQQTVEQIAERAKPSVVVIVSGVRDAKKNAIGTGFVVGDGLIVTNYHVIGEARPIQVQLSDGTRHDVTSIHASDRNLDLAILRIAKTDLKPLPLDDTQKLKQGQGIVVLGHPHKLEYSVVAGVLSGQREVEGQNMLQLAIPIESGNSGGPVLDMTGKVLGIVTMRSLVTPNLGFAVPVATLKPLLERPNPIPMDRWLTIGQLDKSEWKTLHGGRWRQRAGRIIADGLGTGFGGRTLCFRVLNSPLKMPFELAVAVKLHDESGAAGLVFGGDGGDRHYGFYPTGGKLRFTLFDGPDVFSWKIIEEINTPHYRPGEWNYLKVRVDRNVVSCYCNDELVTEMVDPNFVGHHVGLTRFRAPTAEFKKFQIADRIAPATLPVDEAAKLKESIAKLPLDRPADGKQLDPLMKRAPQTASMLRDQARQLEKQAEQLRKLARAVHERRTLKDLAESVRGDDDKVDLARSLLLVAMLDNEDLDVDDYVRQLERLGREAAAAMPKNAGEKERIDALNNFLFKERGFHGSRGEYHHRSNSYLNEVLDDREGVPITLSVLYMELARRLNLRIVGVDLPGHFMVRHEPKEGEAQIIDVFDNGKFMSPKDVEDKIAKSTGQPLDKKLLKQPISKKTIVVRVFQDLIDLATTERDQDGLFRYLDGLLTVAEDAHKERFMRAALRFQIGQLQEARKDVDILLEAAQDSVNLNRVRELKMAIEEKSRK